MEETSYRKTLGMALDACNVCDSPVTTPNLGGYCDDCMAPENLCTACHIDPIFTDGLCTACVINPPE